mmetsp:Transcript_46944/g.94782  ORF Transcript_46944/g.94782 Transcript_46944/m.94782 type:complete len:224 (-) Transcript_46944:90-761(-)
MSRSVSASVAGLCYLIVIGGGLFAEVVVRESLVVQGDAVATARSISQNEMLWRLGLAVHLLYLIPAMVVNVLVSGLFWVAWPTLAHLALMFGVACVVIEGVACVFLYVPLALIDSGATLAMLEDAANLIYLATQMYVAGFCISLLLFSGFCILIGTLIARSCVVPRWIGALMVVAGFCYVVNTVTFIVSPNVHKMINPAVLLPVLIGELSLAVCLLKGTVKEP